MNIHSLPAAALRPSLRRSLIAITALVVIHPSSAQTSDAELLKKLASRVDQLEHELAEVKGTAAAAPEPAADTTYPRVRFSGFVDMTYHVTDAKDDHNHFELGEMDFFINSRISENAGVIVETVVAADQTNTFGIDIERLMFQYKFNDAFHLDVGRFHTSLGWYNTEYHHGTWFQTATGRPSFLQYEDSGGLVPVHTVGLSLNGAIPSGGLGLHYAAEVGNGRSYRDPASGYNPVANVWDNDGAKAVNFELFARPTALPGLQFGAGVYHDSVRPDGQVRNDELIANGHIVYKDAQWELMAEAYSIRHRPDHGRTSNSSAWFAQASRGFGSLRPYLRYTFQNVPTTDGPFGLLGLDGRHSGPALGLRWDFTDYAAYKLQADHTKNSDGPSTNELTAQVALTF